MNRLFRDRWDRLIGVLISASLVAAWLLRHIEDDAFITFRYSKHLAEGFGAVWNLGEPPIEGYSNPLWMLLMAVPESLSIDTTLCAQILGTAFLGLNLSFSWKTILQLGAKGPSAFFIFLPIALNYTLLCYGTSGLETSLNGFLWTLMAHVLVGRLHVETTAPPPTSIFIGFLAFLLILSRPDGWLMALPALSFLLFFRRIRPILSLLAFLFPTTLFFLLRLQFYGGLLPNTFQVKGGFEFGEGLFYVTAFLLVYGFLFPLIQIGISGLRRKTKTPPALLFLGLVSFLWAAYMAAVGGDYMEFRMFVPVLPLFIIFLGEMVRRNSGKMTPVLAALLVLFSGLHAIGHGRLYSLRFITPVHRYVPADTPPFLSFKQQAEGISNLLGQDETLVFGSGNIGAYAYVNEFRWVDLYGLNDAWIARNGERRDWGPGHRIVAPFEHLLDRGVNLVSVACHHVRRPEAHGPYDASQPGFEAALGDWRPDAQGFAALRVLALPVSPQHHLLCLYLRPHPAVESMVAAEKLKIWDLQFKEE